MTIDWTHRAYFATAARSTGVPEMWLEDATQDIALAVWRRGASVRYAAVDAARRYGRHGRNGKDRTMFSLDDVEVAVPDTLSSGVEAAEVLAQLSPAQQAAVVKRMRGDEMTDSERMRLYSARRRLRR